ncbi:MAG: sigma-70 family RNA polymerase sigma factor [Polyangiaceae bacterium]
MSTAMSSDVSPSRRFLAEPGMRRAIEDFVRRRVPASDVDDIVQTVLVEALSAPARPQDETELRKWLLGIARHKVVDHHRRASRETASELPDLPVGPPPIEARALAEWAEKQAGGSGDARSTLDWMAREGEGEKLEAIAADEKVPAARVRQRVSRMRRWMKERWLAELAAAAALVVFGLILWRLLRKEEPIADPGPEPAPSITAEPRSLDRARALRAEAFKACDRSSWQECLDRFDEAKSLDPEGDTDPAVGAARARATEALEKKDPGPKTAPEPTTNNDAPPDDKTPPTKAPVPTSAPVQKKPPPPPPAPKKGDPFQKSGVKRSKPATKGGDLDYFKK